MAHCIDLESCVFIKDKTAVDGQLLFGGDKSRHVMALILKQSVLFVDKSV